MRIARTGCHGWLEIDLHEPEALATVRRSSTTPVASLESIYGRRQYRPFFERYAVDVAIIDVPRNDDLVTHPPQVKDGELIVPTRPGWGCDVNEEAVRAHPPKQPR